MKIIGSVGICLLTVLAGQVLASQRADRPSFAGRWTDAEGAERLIVAYSHDSITLTSTIGKYSEVLTYRLDGTASKNSLRTLAGETWTSESNARWVGNSLLVVSNTSRTGGGSWESILVLSLDAADGWLNEVTVDHAHEGGPGMITRTKRFRKLPD